MAAMQSNDALDLPPGYSAITLREHGDAYVHACRVAPEAGAGTLVWVRRFDLVETAVVLEPEQPLAAARRVFFCGMNAAADALALHCPPEKPLTFNWPDGIVLDGGLVGGMRMGWDYSAGETDVPRWMVLGLMLRTTITGPRDWSAANPNTTSLEEEGVEILSAAELINSFSRHLLTRIDHWLNDGFTDVGRDYLGRLTPEKGTRRGIDTNGDLLVHKLGVDGPAARRSLTEGLSGCGWMNWETGEPVL